MDIILNISYERATIYTLDKCIKTREIANKQIDDNKPNINL